MQCLHCISVLLDAKLSAGRYQGFMFPLRSGKARFAQDGPRPPVGCLGDSVASSETVELLLQHKASIDHQDEVRWASGRGGAIPLALSNFESLRNPQMVPNTKSIALWISNPLCLY